MILAQGSAWSTFLLLVTPFEGQRKLTPANKALHLTPENVAKIGAEFICVLVAERVLVVIGRR